MQKQLVWAVAMPLGIAIVCMAVAWRPWRRSDRESIRGWWGGVIAIGAAYLVGHVTINKWPAWPPVQSSDWLFLIAIAGIVVGLVESLRAPVAVRWILRALLCAAVSWSMISNGYKSEHSAAAIAGLAALQAAVVLLVWTITERLAQRRSGPAVPLALSLLIAAASVCFLQSNSAKMAQLAGVLSAALGGASLVAMTVGGVSAARGMLAVVFPLYSALLITMLYAWHDPPLPWWPPAVLAVAPVALWLGEWRESVTATIGRVLLVVTPGLMALALLLWYLLSASAQPLY